MEFELDRALETYAQRLLAGFTHTRCRAQAWLVELGNGDKFIQRR